MNLRASWGEALEDELTAHCMDISAASTCAVRHAQIATARWLVEHADDIAQAMNPDPWKQADQVIMIRRLEEVLRDGQERDGKDTDDE